MKVSVVIPAYNEEKSLPTTIASIEQLIYSPDEILVIDGGSTDHTREVAEKLGARVVSVPHRGIGFARQRGLEEAKGDIIAFTDADTIVPHDWLTKIVASLSKDGVSGVYSGFNVPDGWYPYRFFVNMAQPIFMIFLDALGMPLAPGQNSSFWKQKAIEAGGYPIDFKLAEDLEMARRLRTVGKMVFRMDNFVTSSGRRGNEGPALVLRMVKALWLYYTQRRGDKIGFPDIR